VRKSIADAPQTRLALYVKAGEVDDFFHTIIELLRRLALELYELATLSTWNLDPLLRHRLVQTNQHLLALLLDLGMHTVDRPLRQVWEVPAVAPGTHAGLACVVVFLSVVAHPSGGRSVTGEYRG